MKSLKNFLLDEHGAELAEYAVGTAIVVVIAIIVYQILGDAINSRMEAVVDELEAPPASSGTP
ncbi:MAG TPA: hypothetical protein VHH35_00310 [Pyrinomonadaceae bacterium]|nr:hypothetical protein [Pyrinomonadaceae bacterium]